LWEKEMTEKEIDLLLEKIEKRNDWITNNDVTTPSLEDIQFEKAVLGSIIEYNELHTYLYKSLSEESFIDLKHQKVMSAIIELFCISAPLKVPNISTELKEMNEYEFVGGQAFLDDLLTYSLINKKNE
jgi:replicative DNA helicase